VLLSDSLLLRCFIEHHVVVFDPDPHKCDGEGVTIAIRLGIDVKDEDYGSPKKAAQRRMEWLDRIKPHVDLTYPHAQLNVEEVDDERDEVSVTVPTGFDPTDFEWIVEDIIDQATGELLELKKNLELPSKKRDLQRRPRRISAGGDEDGMCLLFKYRFTYGEDTQCLGFPFGRPRRGGSMNKLILIFATILLTVLGIKAGLDWLTSLVLGFVIGIGFILALVIRKSSKRKAERAAYRLEFDEVLKSAPHALLKAMVIDNGINDLSLATDDHVAVLRSIIDGKEGGEPAHVAIAADLLGRILMAKDGASSFSRDMLYWVIQNLSESPGLVVRDYLGRCHAILSLELACEGDLFDPKSALYHADKAIKLSPYEAISYVSKIEALRGMAYSTQNAKYLLQIHDTTSWVIKNAHQLGISIDREYWENKGNSALQSISA
jgi:hypothetical protein